MTNPIYSQNLILAAQFAYDTRLSKPYTNTKVQWDWEYNGIQRPNHGLAHSARGALYAPAVVEYFKHFAQDKENYQFTAADLEKIQIALMFRVTGRENDAGYSDDPVAYVQYQKAHANNFREYCKAHPEVFFDNTEIEKYATLLETYAKPDALSPLAIVFKTCHNLDLLRVRDPLGMEKELKETIRVIGRENVQELMVYADNCIRATGNRVLASNPVVGKPSQDYDNAIFSEVSTNVTKCFQAISAVPMPKRIQALTVDDLPNTIEKMIKVPHTREECNVICVSLLAQSDPLSILIELKRLIKNDNLPNQERMNILNNFSMILQSFLSTPIPPEAFKPLVDYLAGDAEIKIELGNADLILAYKNVIEAAQKTGMLPNNAIQIFSNMAKVNQLKTIEYYATPKTNSISAPIVNIKEYIKSNLAEGNSFSENISKQFAKSLKAKNVDLLANVRHGDLISPFIDSLRSTSSLLEFSEKLGQSIINDILKAKSPRHQDNIIDFYHAVMQESVREGDFNSAICIANTLKSPLFEFLPMRAETEKLMNSAYLDSFIAKVKAKNTAALKEFTANTVPIFSELLEAAKPNNAVLNENGFSRFKNTQQIVSNISKTKEYFSKHPVASSIDISQIERKRITSAKQRVNKYKNADPDRSIRIEDITRSDMWNFSLKSRNEKLFNILNNHLELPIYLKITKNNAFLSKEKMAEELANITKQFIDEITASSLDKKEIKKELEKLAIVTAAVENYINNQKINQPIVNKKIKSIQQILTANGITTNIIKLKKDYSAIKKWAEGKSSTPKNKNEPALEMGPLPKNPYTQQFENLVKGMLANDQFTVRVSTNASTSKNEAIVSMNGVEYNLQEIMKYANPNHVQFTEAEKKAYVDTLIARGYLNFAPQWPNSGTANGNAILSLDASFISSDPSLTEIAQAERLAINIYTTGFYTTANAFLRGAPATDIYNDTSYLWEVICHSAMAVSGLNGITNDVPDVVYRGEYNLPQAVLDQRIHAAQTGGVTVEAGFISTSQDKPEAEFMPGGGSNKVAVLFKDLKGKNVQKLSAVPREREFLMPPTQIQWVKHVDANGLNYLEGKPVTTPQYMPEEALKMVDLQAVAEQQAKMKELKAKQKLEEQFTKAVNEAKSVDILIATIQDYQSKGLTITKDPNDTSKLVQYFKDYSNAPHLIEMIANQGKLPSEFPDNIIDSKFSIVINQFTQLVANYYLTLEIEKANSLDEFFAVLDNFKGPMVNSVGFPLASDKENMLNYMKFLSAKKTLLNTLIADPDNLSSILATKGNVTNNYGIRDKFIDLVLKQAKLNVINDAINDATTQLNSHIEESIESNKYPGDMLPLSKSQTVDIDDALVAIDTRFFFLNLLEQTAEAVSHDTIIKKLCAIKDSDLLSSEMKAKEAWQFLYEQKDQNVTAWNAIKDLGLDVNLSVAQVAPPLPPLPPIPSDPLPLPPVHDLAKSQDNFIDESLFIEKIKSALDINMLYYFIEDYQGNMVSSNGTPLSRESINAMIIKMEDIFKDDALVVDIADNNDGYKQFLENQGITANYGICDKFIAFVNQRANYNQVYNEINENKQKINPEIDELFAKHLTQLDKVDIDKAIKVVEQRFWDLESVEQHAEMNMFDKTMEYLSAIKNSTLLSSEMKAKETWEYLNEQKDQNVTAWNAIKDLGLNVNLSPAQVPPPLPPLPPVSNEIYEHLVKQQNDLIDHYFDKFEKFENFKNVNKIIDDIKNQPINYNAQINNLVEKKTSHLSNLLNMTPAEINREYRKLSEEVSTGKWMYQKAKKVGKALSKKGKERQKQLNTISYVISKLQEQDIPNQDKAATIYLLLSDIERKINKEHNVFSSGLKKFCQQNITQLENDFPILNDKISTLDDPWLLVRADDRLHELISHITPPEVKVPKKKG